LVTASTTISRQRNRVDRKLATTKGLGSEVRPCRASQHVRVRASLLATAVGTLVRSLRDRNTRIARSSLTAGERDAYSAQSAMLVNRGKEGARDDAISSVAYLCSVMSGLEPLPVRQHAARV
jgi:hypothetical protein